MRGAHSCICILTDEKGADTEISALFADLYKLIGDAGRIVRRTDDAAAEKAVFLQQMAHDGVILVGVGPQVGTLRPAEGDDQRKNAL